MYTYQISNVHIKKWCNSGELRTKEAGASSFLYPDLCFFAWNFGLPGAHSDVEDLAKNVCSAKQSCLLDVRHSQVAVDFI